MLKEISFLITITFMLYSCSKVTGKNLKKNSYYLTISTGNGVNNKVFLQKISTNKEIDSTIIKNGKAIFKGSIDFPERYLITIEDYFGGKMIVLENDSITVEIKNKDLINSNITGSKLNNELFNVQKNSEKIYNKMDVLFPDMQRARLENDAEKLGEISTKMSLIEQENIDYSFNYVKENPGSYISAMILSDLSKRDSIDKKKIIEYYNSLNESVKKSIDAQKIEAFIKGLH